MPLLFCQCIECSQLISLFVQCGGTSVMILLTLSLSTLFKVMRGKTLTTNWNACEHSNSVLI